MLLRYKIEEILDGEASPETIKKVLDEVKQYTYAQSKKLTLEKAKIDRLKKKLASTPDNLPRVISDYDTHMKVIVNSMRRVDICGLFYDKHFSKFCVKSKNIDEQEHLELIGIYTAPYKLETIKEDMTYVLNN